MCFTDNQQIFSQNPSEDIKIRGGILFAGPTAEFGENIVDGVGDVTEQVSLVSLCHSFVFIFFVR
jgi:hypothetical protein